MNQFFKETFPKAIHQAHWYIKQFFMFIVAWHHSRRSPISIPSIAIEISTHCNRRCSYCPVSVTPKPQKYIEWNIYTLIIRQLEAIQYSNRLAFHLYNEPLLHPQIADLISYAHKRLPKAKLILYSNGDFFTPDIYYSLRAAGLTQFIISVHESKQRFWYLKKTVKQIKTDTNTKITLRIINYQSALFNRGATVNVANRRRLKYCVYPSYECIINIDGNVLLCCNDYFNQNILGDLTKESLTNIWTSPKIRQLRSQLLKGNFRLPICKLCSS